MSKPTKATDFLRAMGQEPIEPPLATPAPTPAPALADVSAAAKELPPSQASRASLKHIGGYFDTETVEQVAILRARLKLDNSALLKLAIDDLYKKQNAKRSFGDN